MSRPSQKPRPHLSITNRVTRPIPLARPCEMRTQAAKRPSARRRARQREQNQRAADAARDDAHLSEEEGRALEHVLGVVLEAEAHLGARARVQRLGRRDCSSHQPHGLAWPLSGLGC